MTSQIIDEDEFGNRFKRVGDGNVEVGRSNKRSRKGGKGGKGRKGKH